MPPTPDDNAFRKGLSALSEGRHDEAVALFEAAMKLGNTRVTVDRRMRYLSYYGLSNALARRPSREAIRACEVAAKRQFLSAELQLNLGKVYLLAGKTTKALAVLERGLLIAPDHEALQSELARADRRRRPPIPWMSRDHPLNCFLGRLRSSLAARNARRRTVET